MSEFTPGPWRVIPWEEKAIRIVPDAYIGPVGEVFGHKGQPMKANANLLAAAPELYEALDTLTLVVGLTPIAGNKAALQEAFDVARAALKKARGE
jgi:hypothetical protein